MSAPSWVQKLPMEAIATAAAQFSLDVNVVAAIVMTESGGKTWVARYEKQTDKYTRHLASHSRILGQTQETELIQQKMSWGLMQIMGFKARELGFEGYLPMLCLPHVGLEWGCRALERFLERERGDYFRAVASYNAGSVRYQAGKLTKEAYVLKVAGYAQELSGPPVMINRG